MNVCTYMHSNAYIVHTHLIKINVARRQMTFYRGNECNVTTCIECTVQQHNVSSEQCDFTGFHCVPNFQLLRCVSISFLLQTVSRWIKEGHCRYTIWIVQDWSAPLPFGRSCHQRPSTPPLLTTNHSCLT